MVTRDAAEVVLESARKRVEAEGGAKVVLKRRRDAMSQWSMEAGEDRGRRRDPDDDDDRDEGEDEEEEEDVPEGLSMAMMLRCMNIDPDLIGWDEKNERWKD